MKELTRAGNVVTALWVMGNAYTRRLAKFKGVNLLRKSKHRRQQNNTMLQEIDKNLPTFTLNQYLLIDLKAIRDFCLVLRNAT
jgi:hypothetical protein